VVTSQTCAIVDVCCVQVSLLAVVAGPSTFLRTGSVAAKVQAGGGCSFISGGTSATQAAFPGAGVRAAPLGTECCDLAGEVLDKPQKGHSEHLPPFCWKEEVIGLWSV
jgi:hypothetical protein